MAKPPTRPRTRKASPVTMVHPFDEAHGLDTGGLIPAAELTTGHPNDEHVTAYYGVAPSILRSLIERWRDLDPSAPLDDYTFIDVGAGKGRALFVASELPFHEVLGVELNPALAATARRNLTLWLASHHIDPTAALLAPIRILEEDALKLELPHTRVLLFLFHPFEAPVLRKLLRRVETQLAHSSHPALDLLYVNAECSSVVDRHPAFTRLWSGDVAMSHEDHAAEIAIIATQKEYGTTGDEECAIYRYTGRLPREGHGNSLTASR